MKSGGPIAGALVITYPRPGEVFLVEPGYDARTQTVTRLHALLAELPPKQAAKLAATLTGAPRDAFHGDRRQPALLEQVGGGAQDGGADGGVAGSAGRTAGLVHRA